jgi:hypothetical protein
MLLITDANIFMDLEKIALWMIEKLKLLKEINCRLPINEIDKRIEEYR